MYVIEAVHALATNQPNHGDPHDHHIIRLRHIRGPPKHLHHEAFANFDCHFVFEQFYKCTQTSVIKRFFFRTVTYREAISLNNLPKGSRGNQTSH